MPSSNPAAASEPSVELKDPFVAGLLAWLIPGLGHFYQGRMAKGALYAICIWSTFIYGLYLGGDSTVGWGRTVYFNFDEKEWRLQWFCQIGVGLPTFPLTLLQYRLRNKPILHGFMAPPAPDRDLPDNPSLATLQRRMPPFFDLGSVYTMIAGLLNILAIYDACCGPVIAAEKEQKEDGSDETKPGGEKEKS